MSSLKDLDPEKVQEAKVFTELGSIEEKQGEYERISYIYCYAVIFSHLDTYSDGLYRCFSSSKYSSGLIHI